MAESFGRRVGRLMDERGLKAKDLETPTGLDRETIRRLIVEERGTSFEAGLKLARALKVDPWDLAGVAPPTGDYRITFKDGSSVNVDLRVDRRSDHFDSESFLRRLDSVLSSAFANEHDGIIRTAQAIKPAVDDETESLGHSLATLQDSVDQALDKLASLEKRVVKIETAPVKARGTAGKAASR